MNIMKRFYNVISIASLGFAMLLTACSLDADNKANVDADDFIGTDEGPAYIRTYMYNSLKPLATETYLTEWGTDLYTSARTTNVNDFQAYKFSPETQEISNYYKNTYSMINQANALIKYASDNARYVAEGKFLRNYGYYLLTQQFGSVPYVTEYIDGINKYYPRVPLKELYDNMIAELESIKNSADLPEEDHNGNISRRAVKALLSKVCLAAGWDLETEITDAAHGTYTINGTSYFTKAAQYSEETIAGQQLTMSFEDKWSPKNEGNDEEIFSVQYDRDGYPGDILKGGHNRQSTYGSEYGNTLYEGLKSCNSELASSKKTLYLWDKGDERLEGTFMMTIYNYTPGEWGTTGYYAYYNASEEAKSKMNIAFKYFPYWTERATIDQYVAENKERFVKGASVAKCHVALLQCPSSSFWWFKENGDVDFVDVREFDDFKKTNAGGLPPVKKFDDPNTLQTTESQTNDYRDIVLFHLSDIYLVAAEAYLMSGNEGKALSYINDVRRRAHATQINSISEYQPKYERQASFGNLTLLDLILDERARELYAETTRWVDLRRTRQLVRYAIAFNDGVSSVSDMANAYGEIKWLRPIPASEIATNTRITKKDQNPGY